MASSTEAVSTPAIAEHHHLEEHGLASISTGANGPREIKFRWRTDDDDKRDAEAAEAGRLRDVSSASGVATAPRPSNTRLSQSPRTRTEILRRPTGPRLHG